MGDLVNLFSDDSGGLPRNCLIVGPVSDPLTYVTGDRQIVFAIDKENWIRVLPDGGGVELGNGYNAPALRDAVSELLTRLVWPPEGEVDGD